MAERSDPPAQGFTTTKALPPSAYFLTALEILGIERLNELLQLQKLSVCACVPPENEKGSQPGGNGPKKFVRVPLSPKR